MPLDEDVVQDLSDPAKYTKYLGNERYYRDYLAFFQKEMEKKGYEEVINEYMFKGDERADDLLVRMYAGMIFHVEGCLDQAELPCRLSASNYSFWLWRRVQTARNYCRGLGSSSYP